MPIVRMPDGTKVKFPEDMPEEQIRDMITSKFPQVAEKSKQIIQTSNEWTPERQAKLDELKANMPEKSSFLRDFGEGFIKGVSGGLERLASGATFGAYDWVSDKLGLGAKERKKELYDLTGTTGKVIGTGLEIIGGIAPGAQVAKATTAGLKAIPKVGAGVAKVASIPLSGGVESAIQTGFDTDSLSGVASGFGYGTALSGIMGGGLGMGRKLFSTRTATKGVKGGLENAVKSSAGARLLSRGVGASDDVASMIRQQGQEALEETNKRTLKALDTAIGQRTTVSDEMSKAKQAYANFIDENKAQQIINPIEEAKRYSVEENQYQPVLKSIRRHMEKTEPNFKMALKKDGKIDYNEFIKDRQRREYIGTLPSTYKKPSQTILGKHNGKAREYLLRQYFNPDNGKKVYDIAIKSNDGTLIDKFAREGRKGLREHMKIMRQSSGDTPTVAVGKESIGGASSSLPRKGIIQQNYGNVKKNFLGISDLTEQQNEWLNQAWKDGLKNTNEKAGSLGHLDEMSKSLNDMISNSMKPSNTGVGMQASKQTQRLQVIKDKLDDIITNAGLKDVKNQYARAKGLQNAYDFGLNYNAGAVKTRKLPFTTQAEKQAFADGLMERILMGTDTKNVSKAILDNQRVLKEVLPENKVSKLLRVAGENETAYGRIEQLGRKAETKLRTPEANRLFAREQGESKGALFGSILDYLNDKARAGVFTRGSKRVLNPNFVPRTGMRIGDILTPVISSDIISKNINIGEE